MTPFKRIQLDALSDSAWGTPSDVGLLHAPIPNVRALDWLVQGVTGTMGIRKAGANILTFSELASSAGGIYDGTTPAMTFTDGPSGTGSVSTSYYQGPGLDGWQVTCPVPRWPDWREIHMLYYSGLLQAQFSATMDDTDAAVDMPGETIDWLGGTLYGSAEQAPDVTAGGTRTVKVKFASELAGRTLTFKFRRNGPSMGNIHLFGVALFKSAFSAQRPRGAARINASIAGLFSPKGGAGIT